MENQQQDHLKDYYQAQLLLYSSTLQMSDFDIIIDSKLFP